jgi:hypothetical protein
MALNIPCTSCGRNDTFGRGAAGLDVPVCGVVLGVEGAGLEGVELCVEPRPAKELVYVFDHRPYTSRLALQAYSNNVVISK